MEFVCGNEKLETSCYFRVNTCVCIALDYSVFGLNAGWTPKKLHCGEDRGFLNKDLWKVSHF